MDNLDAYTKSLYCDDEYILRNPTLHREDSSWKVSKIIPLVDKLMSGFDKNEMNLLDVGGGAGVIINAVSRYISNKYNIKVNKYLLDLSPGMLEVQMKENPDFKRALNENICETSISEKEMDLTLMVDILEHIPDDYKALMEVKRISKFVIFKVPLEDSLSHRIWNFVRRGKPRRHLAESVGHINFYNFRAVKYRIEKYTGQIMYYYFTNAFDYLRKSEYYWGKMNLIRRLKNIVAEYTYKISPRLCSEIFGDFAMILVKCH